MKFSKSAILFIIIICFSGILIFFRLTRADFQTDGAFYSMWSVGYLDYLFSDRQTTPVQWFFIIPWWARLSFHAHPPLVFIIQNIFFRVFWENEFTALLPFALAGIGSLILLYYIAKKLYDKNTALMAVFFLGISTLFTWASRVTYLEGVVIFFILLAILFFLKSFEKQNYFPLFGACLGMAFLTKYTTFFLIPLIVSYAYFRDKKILFSKKFFVAMAVFAVVFSPVIFYNFMLFKTRGHFDVQFSHIFPWVFEAAKKDWPILFTQNLVTSPYANFLNIGAALGIGYSKIFIGAILISVTYIAAQIFLRKKKHHFLFLAITSLAVEFSFISPNIRYMAIWSPFLALALAVCIMDFYNFVIRDKEIQTQKKLLCIFVPLIIFFASMEIYFNMNTNIFAKPMGVKDKNYSSLRAEDLGFKNLEKHMLEIWKKDKLFSSDVKAINALHDITFYDVNFADNNIYLYENGLDWFATTWYLERYKVYHGMIMSSDLTFWRSSQTADNWFALLQERKMKNFYYIKGVAEKVFNPSYYANPKQSELSGFVENEFLRSMEDNAPVTVENVFDDDGVLIFKVYRARLNE